MRALYLLIGLLLGINYLSFSQELEYHLTFKVEGIKNDTALFAYNYGEKKFIADSIIFDSNGTGILKKQKDYPAGVYLLVFPSMGNNYFELIMNKETNFEMSTSSEDFISKMVVKNSAENKLFYEDVSFMVVQGKKMEEIRQKMESEQIDDATKKDLESQLQVLSAEIKTRRKKFIAENPSLLYAKLLKSMQEIEVPNAPLNAQGEPEPNFAYYHTRDHYFDGIDFSDPGLIRTPVLLPKVMRFLDEMILPNPDTVKIWAEKIIEKGNAHPEMFQILLSEILNKFAKSNIMGQEGIYVYLVDKYYAAGKATWVDEETIAKMKERADALRPTIIGSKAPDMNVYGLDGSIINLYKSTAQNKYTVLAFWNSECGHCKKEIPELKRILLDSLAGYDVGVFSVSTEIEKEHVEKFIEEKEITEWVNGYDPTGRAPFRKLYDLIATPVVIILDEEKTIIAKKVAVKDIKYIVDSHNKYLEFQAQKKKGN